MSRFIFGTVQVLLIIVVLGGIAFSVYQIWQCIQDQSYEMIWMYGLLFILCSYTLGFIIDRNYINDVGSC